MAAANRKQIGKKLRFEVFKRDGFKCQYCGCSAPDVVLHVDHIHPVAEGGDNDIMNLVTSCQPCNSGKGATTLSDSSAVQVQRKQLQELNERREQLEMMLKWKADLHFFHCEAAYDIELHINDMIEPHAVTDSGQKFIQAWVKKFTAKELMDAIDVAASKFLASHGAQVDDRNAFFSFIPKAANFKRKPEAEQRIRYARGILRNRLSYINEEMALQLMNDAVGAGLDIEALTSMAKSARNWTGFRKDIEEFIHGQS
jgi:hypothetical protein